MKAYLTKISRSSHCLTVLVVLLLTVPSFTQGQDVHFSQFYNTPMAVNPALTGVFDGIARVCNNYRSQWSSLGKGYKTISLSGETQLRSRSSENQFFGLGLIVYQDKAGEAQFKKTLAEGSFSFTTAIDDRAGHWISFGLQTGINQLSFDMSKATWDEQWNGDRFDGTIPTTEIIQLPSFSYLDVNAGANYFYIPDDYNSVSFGASVSHLLKPNTTFYAPLMESLYGRRLTLHGSGDFALNDNRENFINPRVFFQLQGKQKELVAGGYYRNKLRFRSLYTGYQKDMFVDFGAFYRLKESVIASVRFNYYSFGIGFSYDVGVGRLSRLISANSWEIGLSYIPPVPRGQRKYSLKHVPRFF
jgi:type IX secretion system PorP/SprF family membrane protein